MPQQVHRLVALLLGCMACLGACAGSRPEPPGGADGGACSALPGCTGQFCCAADNLCQSVICEGRAYVCKLEGARFSWSAGEKALCDDGDPCTTGDQCVSDTCLGLRVVCDTPPPSTCLDSTTLRTFAAKGSCTAGTCEHSPTDTPCPSGCQNGQCVGDACLGLSCDQPPSPCHESPGSCNAGQCTYLLKAAGSICATGSSCQSGGTCDAQGVCQTTGMTCTAPNATGTCVNGACQFSCASGWANCNGSWTDGCEANLSQNGNCGSCGKSCAATNAVASCVSGACQFTCSAGWGNCNSSWTDGCETSLTSTSNCGACGKTCPAASHATASCSAGTCKITCVAPYQNCDGNIANGCEIPVGVANRCNKQGLTTAGCGTAHCGSSSTTGAANFGSWTCVFCQHCHHYASGYSWCLYNPGPGEFSPDRCSTCCNDSLTDKVCPK